MPFEPDETTMMDLATGVRPPGAALTAELAAELHARAAWSCISEPGDGTAGLVVGALGAVPALRLVIEAWSPDRVARELLAAGVEQGTVVAAGLDRALERWRPRLDPVVVMISLRQAARSGARLAIPGDHDWPAGLEDLGVHAPLALWWRGPADALGAFRESYREDAMFSVAKIPKNPEISRCTRPSQTYIPRGVVTRHRAVWVHLRCDECSRVLPPG